MSLPLEVSTQVVDGVQVEGLVPAPVLGSESVQGVGPEDPAPAGPPPVGRRVAAEIPEVGDPLEGQPTFGDHDRPAAVVRSHRDIVAPGPEAVDTGRVLACRDRQGVGMVDGVRAGADADVDSDVVAGEAPADLEGVAVVRYLNGGVGHERAHVV